MSKTLRYRLFKVGAMPPALREKIRNDTVLFLDEGVSVTVRRKGSAPGYRGNAVGIFSGAFAVTDKRVVASISKSIVVEAPNDTAETKGAEASLNEAGLHVRIDASIHPQCAGAIEMDFKRSLSQEELQRFPRRQITFNFPPELVPKMFGAPG